jgi:hypothetical protein
MRSSLASNTTDIGVGVGVCVCEMEFVDGKRNRTELVEICVCTLWEDSLS